MESVKSCCSRKFLGHVVNRLLQRVQLFAFFLLTGGNMQDHSRSGAHKCQPSKGPQMWETCQMFALSQRNTLVSIQAQRVVGYIKSGLWEPKKTCSILHCQMMTRDVIALVRSRGAKPYLGDRKWNSPLLHPHKQNGRICFDACCSVVCRPCRQFSPHQSLLCAL